jgi:hypothetical protein
MKEEINELKQQLARLHADNICQLLLIQYLLHEKTKKN